MRLQGWRASQATEAATQTILFLLNARSLANNMDELRLQIAVNNYIKDPCILLITETCLHQLIPDHAIELAGYTTQRYD